MDEQNRLLPGHLLALFTALLWGTTFISTKVLLRDFSPLEILIFRMLIGYGALLAVCPKRLALQKKSHEWLFAGAGLTGVSLYYLLENTALDHSTASNVGVIVAVAPFFSALFARFFLKEEKIGRAFVLGFLTALGGIFLIGFNGASALRLNPLGDLLAFLAALVWGLYSVFSRRLGTFGYNMILLTRRIFFYGIIFLLPAGLFMDFRWELGRFARPVNLLNILFLGVGASAACYATWNQAIKILGVNRTSVYIYLIPVISVILSALVLKETITPLAAAGTALTLGGLILSERKSPPAS